VPVAVEREQTFSRTSLSTASACGKNTLIGTW
jgi:hypothetical protein